MHLEKDSKQTNNEETNNDYPGIRPYIDNANIAILRPEGDEQERNRRKRKGFQESPASMERKESCLLWRCQPCPPSPRRR